MRIGIDAKWYFEGPPSGRRVVRALVDTLARMYPNTEFYFFLNKRDQRKTFPPSGPNIYPVYVWAGNSLLSNLFVVPVWASRLKLDVVLYQNFVPPFGASKKVAYIHDVLFLSHPEFYTIYERLYFSPLRFLTLKADAVITVSEEERKRLIRYAYVRKTNLLSVVHHGVDSTFQPRESHSPELVHSIRTRYALPERFLLYVGRLNLRKNVDNLLRAIPLLKDKSIPLVVVGSANWKESDHERTVQSLGIEQRIIFVGSVYDNLGVLYSLATVFCFPSFAESFGLPPLEAMASGVPVVVSNTTSLPEVCGEAGTYADPLDPASIAKAIDSILGNAQLYAEMRRKGIDQAARFTWEKAAEKVLQVLTDTTKPPKREETD
jgi:glycosyltransferase involved in cell wall biosynthesis